VGREVFVPRPRVDSALVALRRIAPGPAPEVRALVRAAFSTRRKTVVNALGGAGADRGEVVRALAAIGLPADVRPQAVSPAAYAALAGELAWTG
jgi:16S rRNA (adenine1518-N6/adenine1519-N6)-dimethyltransferase